jgi:catalase
VGKRTEVFVRFSTVGGEKGSADADREHLIGNIISSLKNADKEIQIRQTQIFNKSDTEYGQRVAESLGITT